MYEESRQSVPARVATAGFVLGIAAGFAMNATVDPHANFVEMLAQDLVLLTITESAAKALWRRRRQAQDQTPQSIAPGTFLGLQDGHPVIEGQVVRSATAELHIPPDINHE